MKQSFNEYTRKANKMATDYKDYICSDALVEDKDEILHMMLVQFKNELDAMYDKFVKEHGVNMTEMNYFTFAIKMQGENVKLCDDFSNQVIPRMSYNLFDNQDPRNLIKQCPNCGLIWYKTEGCDGATTCGNRGFEHSTCGSSLREIFNFVMTYIDGKIRVKKNPIKVKAPTSTLGTGVASSGYKGCNAAITWRDLPKLDDELILSLYKVKTMDEAIAMIRADSFTKTKRNYESGIDFGFHV